MDVILFRHGPAGSPDTARWPSDADRPLTPKGIERTRDAARGLRRIAPTISLILTSPYVRALGTARVVADALGVNTLETLDALACGGPPHGVITALSRLVPNQGVVLVGHEPDLGVLAAHLIGAQRPLPLKKAGSCAVRFDGVPRAGEGELLWHVPPRLLRRLAARPVRTRTP
jgi:phosphohistidine phosphatase